MVRARISFVAVCGGCHDINRARAGYTPAGWNTLQHMMQNFGTPIAPEDWPAVTAYLIKASRSGRGRRLRSSRARWRLRSSCGTCRRSARARMIRSRPATVRSGGPDNCPTSLAGSIRKNGTIREYTLKTPHTGPHGLVEDKDGNIWFTGNHAALIGKLDPKTGVVTEYKIPDPKVKDPHSLSFAPDGILWFTAQQSNAVGRLDPKTGEIKLVTMPTPRSRPYGIIVSPKGVPTLCLFGTNKLATVDPNTMEVKEYALPDAASRPRRIAIVGDEVYYADFSRGYPRSLQRRNGRSTRNGPRPADRNRNLTASSLPRTRSGTTSRSPSRTPSCASTRRRKNSRAGQSPAAATSSARWTSRRTAIRSPPTALPIRSDWSRSNR